MRCFIISDDNENKKVYPLKEYKIYKVDEENVIVSFESCNNEVISYELHTDLIFKTVDAIESFLSDVMKESQSKKCDIVISEYFQRMYVSIGYETDQDIKMERFTAKKI